LQRQQPEKDKQYVDVAPSHGKISEDTQGYFHPFSKFSRMGTPRNFGPCRRFRGDQNDEDTRTFCGKFLYNSIASTDNAQHKNCPSSGIDDRPGRDLFRVLKRSPISQLNRSPRLNYAGTFGKLESGDRSQEARNKEK